MIDFYDVFISYGRADSKQFAGQLYERLQERGFRVWFDQAEIPPAVDFQDQIDSGIARTHNFIYIISPHSVNSPYCGKEVDLALSFNKRLIPLLHVEKIERATWQQRNPAGSDADWAACQQRGCHSGLINLHPVLAKLNWIYFNDPAQLERSLDVLTATLYRYSDYIHLHTTLLRQAMQWQVYGRKTHDLLVGSAYEEAFEWLQRTDYAGEPLPCEPTALHADFICSAKKNANNLFCEVAILAAPADREVQGMITRALARHGVTVWEADREVQGGMAYGEALHTGIVQAEAVLFLLSPRALAAEHCHQALAWAVQYHKRMIPVEVEPVAEERLPPALCGMQTVPFGHGDAAMVAKYLWQLNTERDYYQKHTQFLAAALKWARQDHNPGVLLRGYNLENAEAWLIQGKKRDQHPPTDLQEAFINAGLANKGQLQTEIFISYSRKDSGFARRLNAELQTYGKTTWFDQESIAEGEDFKREIFKGIANADNFVFILSPEAVASPFCLEETTFAARLNKRCIPLLYREPPADAIPAPLAAVQWINFQPATVEFDAAFRQLSRLLDTNRAHIRQHTHWHQKADQWHSQGRETALLPRGSELAIAEQWLTEAAGKQPPATALQKDYIRAGVRARQAAARRMRVFIVSLAALLVVAITTSILAGKSYFAAEQARQQEQQERLHAQQAEQAGRRNYARALSTLAYNELAAGRAADALLLGLETLIKPSASDHAVADESDCALLPDARQVIYQSLSELRESRVLPHAGDVTHAVFSPDGRYLASVSKDAGARLWRLPDGHLEHLLLGHYGPIWHAVFSADGKQLLTASEDGSARLWDVDSGRTLAVFSSLWKGGGGGDLQISSNSPLAKEESAAQVSQIPPNPPLPKGGTSVQAAPVTYAAFSPDNTRILTVSKSGTVSVWQTGSAGVPPASGRDARTPTTILEHEDQVLHAAFSPDSQQVATAGADGVVYLWQANGDFEDVLILPEGVPVDTARRVAFSPDGTLLAVGYDTGLAGVWDLASRQLSALLQGHTALLRKVVFSPDGHLLLTASGDGTARLWQDGAVRARLQGHDGPLWQAAFSNDGQLVVTAGWDNTARLWNTDGQLLATLGGHEDYVLSAAFSPDGETIATASLDDTARLWRRRPGRGFETLHTRQGGSLQGRFHPDGSKLLVTGEGGNVRLWQRNGTLLADVTPHAADTDRAAFSPDGRWFATADTEGLVLWWRSADATVQHELEGHWDRIWALLFAPDSRHVVTASQDGTLRMWPLAGDSRLLHQGKHGILTAAFSAHGDLAAGDAGGHIRLWRTDTWQLQHAFNGHTGSVRQVRFQPGSRRLASGGDDGTVRLWDNDQTTAVLHGHEGAVLDLAFSPDGSRLATAGADRTLRVWQMPDGKLLRTLRGHQDRIIDVAFAPQADFLLSASFDDTARLWQAPGVCGVEVLAGHRGFVWQAVFSPDGRQVLTASADGTARLWPLFDSVRQLIDTVRAALPRPLSYRRRLALRLPIPAAMQQASALLAQGRSLAQQGDLQGAEQIFRQALPPSFDPAVRAKMLYVNALLARQTTEANEVRAALIAISEGFGQY